jgi:hypothetical protein
VEALSRIAIAGVVARMLIADPGDLLLEPAGAELGCPDIRAVRQLLERRQEHAGAAHIPSQFAQDKQRYRQEPFQDAATASAAMPQRPTPLARISR